MNHRNGNLVLKGLSKGYHTGGLFSLRLLLKDQMALKSRGRMPAYCESISQSLNPKP